MRCLWIYLPHFEDLNPPPQKNGISARIAVYYMATTVMEFGPEGYCKLEYSCLVSAVLLLLPAAWF